MSEVFYTSLRTRVGESLLDKLERLVRRAGMDKIDFNNKYVAIKLHFGEPGNLAFIRPQYVARIVKLIKEWGGKPFLTDCNTLYVGGRKNALDHLESAYQNGFNPYNTGAHVVIADGLKGLDEVLVPVPDGKHVKEAKIGRALMDADIIISLTHFKGHEAAGFGGVIKNIGMGGGSRAGKMEQHSAGKPYVQQDICVGCHKCEQYCAHDAVHVTDGKSFITEEKCVGCGRCVGVCPVDAISPMWDEANTVLSEKMAEYTAAIVRNRSRFHISFVMDVSPYCDCHGENDMPIVPDVGIMASYDLVALDQACVDKVNAQPPMPGSLLDEKIEKSWDHFHTIAPDTDWEAALVRAEQLGLGTRSYSIVEVK
ncbi:Ferredoxin [Veillonella criceti]|uniref:Ferredoxin n=2 Tax=Veillonella criceti TaxID=103891 RepID=A0A380NNY3_9FIRM|nr:DUF362 domain-containing protein [Veillonella criceti]SUP44613.1 Ferredoxin [Veillonella criceti]